MIYCEYADDNSDLTGIGVLPREDRDLNHI